MSKQAKSSKTTKNTGKPKSTRAKSAKSTRPKKLSFWSKLWRVVLSIIIPLGGGVLIAFFTRDAMAKFGSFNLPPLAPPAWLFPVAWTALYVLMGFACALIWLQYHSARKKADGQMARSALIIYAIQLIFNFAWTPFFFILELLWFSFGWLVIMWLLILALVIKSHAISRSAFWMLLPYLIWCTFAIYLNLGIAILN